MPRAQLYGPFIDPYDAQWFIRHALDGHPEAVLIPTDAPLTPCAEPVGYVVQLIERRDPSHVGRGMTRTSMEIHQPMQTTRRAVAMSDVIPVHPSGLGPNRGLS